MGGQLSNAALASGGNPLAGKTILYDYGYAANGVATLRTVTAGKTYYMLSAGLAYRATADNQSTYLYVDNDTQIFLFMQSEMIATYHPTDTDKVTVTFPYPIPVAAGTLIKVYADAAITGYGWLVGWEE